MLTLKFLDGCFFVNHDMSMQTLKTEPWGNHDTKHPVKPMDINATSPVTYCKDFFLNDRWFVCGQLP